MKGRIVVITDGPAAVTYTPQLLDSLRKIGFTVKVAPTGYAGASALSFITETGWAALSGHPAMAVEKLTPELLQWAEVVLLAPVTPAVLKVFQRTSGLRLIKETGRPILVAPAILPGEFPPVNVGWIMSLPKRSVMLAPNQEMSLGALGNIYVPSVETVVEETQRILSKQLLDGVEVLMTAGPTCEDIDPVRFVTNRSSGKMGLALAKAARNLGAKVTLVHGPVAIDLPDLPNLNYIPVRSAAEMHQAVSERWDRIQLAVLCAAVADFTPDHYAPEKIKKVGAEGLELKLLRTRDILAELGDRDKRPFLVGFAAESDDVEINAISKLRRKHCDIICANDICAPNCGFAVDTNRITLYDKDGDVLELPLVSKQEAAERIVKEIAKRMKKR